MGRILTLDDVESAIRGGSVFAAGGGGWVDHGRMLGTGAVLVGAAVFAIGNPLGLAWSYTGGTLSATRHWTTSDGQSVRILQTNAPIAPGSSGGGLFHSDGHLLGVMSFLRQGHAGGSALFALSIDAIRDALTREDVAWRGIKLADLPR